MSVTVVKEKKTGLYGISRERREGGREAYEGALQWGMVTTEVRRVWQDEDGNEQFEACGLVAVGAATNSSKLAVLRYICRARRVGS